MSKSDRAEISQTTEDLSKGFGTLVVGAYGFKLRSRSSDEPSGPSVILAADMLAVQPRLDVEKEENMSEWIEKMNELSTIPDRETRLQQQSCLVEKSDEQFRKGFAIEIKNYYIAFASARMLYITGELNYGKLCSSGHDVRNQKLEDFLKIVAKLLNVANEKFISDNSIQKADQIANIRKGNLYELFLAICPKNGKSIKEISDDSLQIFREGPIIKQYRLSSDKTTVIPVDLPALNIQRINLTEGEITIFAKGVKEDFALTMLKSFFFIPDYETYNLTKNQVKHFIYGSFDIANLAQSYMKLKCPFFSEYHYGSLLSEHTPIFDEKYYLIQQRPPTWYARIYSTYIHCWRECKWQLRRRLLRSRFYFLLAEMN